MIPAPSTYAYVTYAGMKTLAFIVSVSPSFTVTYRAISRRGWKGKAKWVSRQCKPVDVHSDVPDQSAIEHAIATAGTTP